jgi:hypothetical protein
MTSATARTLRKSYETNEKKSLYVVARHRGENGKITVETTEINEDLRHRPRACFSVSKFGAQPSFDPCQP